MKVSAIIVTRGDVDTNQIVESLPVEWEKVVWVNGHGVAVINGPTGIEVQTHFDTDLSVYGRYAAIDYASRDVIYVQDDDVIVSDPQSIVDSFLVGTWHPNGRLSVVCNMPREFRHDFYKDHALVGFGAAFHRSTPQRAFSRFAMSSHKNGAIAWGTDGLTTEFFDRTCDIVFTGLTSRTLVSVPKENLACAYADNRMWKQPTHVEERSRMLELVRDVA